MKIQQSPGPEGASVEVDSADPFRDTKLPALLAGKKPAATGPVEKDPGNKKYGMLLALMAMAGGGVVVSQLGDKDVDHRSRQADLGRARSAEAVMPFHAALLKLSVNTELNEQAIKLAGLVKQDRKEPGSEARNLVRSYNEELKNIEALIASASGLEQQLLKKCSEAQKDIGQTLQKIIDNSGEPTQLANLLSIQLETYLQSSSHYFRMLQAGERVTLK